MRITCRLIVLGMAFLLVSFPAPGQQPPGAASPAPAAPPFVGNWQGVVAIAGGTYPVHIAIAPVGPAFAAKVVFYHDGAWDHSPIVELRLHGDSFNLVFPSGNRYDGMRVDGDTLRGFFFWRKIGQTAAVTFNRAPS
jgi:hypothetical protein